MTREYKFRAWDKENKKMVSVIHFGNFDDPQYECMQYTGLKDKNGKEIYEWDFVKGKTIMGTEYTSVVFFSRGSFMLSIFEREISYLERDECTFEVIGNYYENPELIK